MAPQSRIQVTNRKWVMPLTPTPPHKRLTPLSDWDIVMFKSYIPLLLFYPNDEKLPNFMNTAALVQSLSKTLVDYYPLAGRLRDIGNGRDEVENCDAGVLFLEAEYSADLEKFRRHGYLPNQMDYHNLFPIHFYCSEEDPLLAIQLTRFMDGGVALGIMMLHKVADFYSTSLFLDAWAKSTRNREFAQATFKRDLISCSHDTIITNEVIEQYQKDHRIVKEKSAILRMDPDQQKYTKTTPNGPMPLKSIILEFHADGLYECKKDAHSKHMIKNKHWLSTKEAMFAMLMRAIARCRKVDSEDTKISMIMSVNGRSIMKNRKELEHYFGNWMISQTLTITQAEIRQTDLPNSALKLHNMFKNIKPSLFHGLSKLYSVHEDMTVNYLTYQPNSPIQSTASDVSMLPFWRLNFGFGRPDRTRGYITFGGNGFTDGRGFNKSVY
ncbi:Shikimate O-hydroxycinnamoyltransferase [Choanephora cucurbitarum]|uniref:Shikimate O-hydroxycinnamoyltransferase n=1 Tax=Choanephora cucurbitarum TaxID=101091 RepID=A0A1C7N6I4_9FUNG|nr:Shikimate O-hydroxycinnamoyltransferase [Choanephora cucurbitarum]